VSFAATTRTIAKFESIFQTTFQATCKIFFARLPSPEARKKSCVAWKQHLTRAAENQNRRAYWGAARPIARMHAADWLR
jgi:hypothetical protein